MEKLTNFCQEAILFDPGQYVAENIYLQFQETSRISSLIPNVFKKLKKFFQVMFKSR